VNQRSRSIGAGSRCAPQWDSGTDPRRAERAERLAVRSELFHHLGILGDLRVLLG
jgi:hypothetical protein